MTMEYGQGVGFWSLSRYTYVLVFMKSLLNLQIVVVNVIALSVLRIYQKSSSVPFEFTRVRISAVDVGEAEDSA